MADADATSMENTPITYKMAAAIIGASVTFIGGIAGFLMWMNSTANAKAIEIQTIKEEVRVIQIRMDNFETAMKDMKQTANEQAKITSDMAKKLDVAVAILERIEKQQKQP